MASECKKGTSERGAVGPRLIARDRPSMGRPMVLRAAMRWRTGEKAEAETQAEARGCISLVSHLARQIALALGLSHSQLLTRNIQLQLLEWTPPSWRSTRYGFQSVGLAQSDPTASVHCGQHHSRARLTFSPSDVNYLVPACSN